MIAVGKDGQPYWSARDLANLFGYSDWRNFADCIRKAREQVASHVSAGQSGSGSVNGFEIARVGKDGQPYWSARDLAKLFGYVDWRNFADAIRKARQQVAAHNIADQGSFVDANKSIPTPKGDGTRLVPDVHLTRFAAYFVALNADQSKPEVRADDTPKTPLATRRQNVRYVTLQGVGFALVSAVVHTTRPTREPPSVTGCATFREVAQ